MPMGPEIFRTAWDSLHDRKGDLGPVYGFQWRHFGTDDKDMDSGEEILLPPVFWVFFLKDPTLMWEVSPHHGSW